MPRYERDTYEPSDQVRIFDGSEEDEDGEGSRLPLLIVLALLVLAMFGGVVWMAYSYGVVHGRTEPREMAAAPGPARIAPASPGGAATPYKGFKIYEQPAPADDEADATPPAGAIPTDRPTPPPTTVEATPMPIPPPPVAAAPKPAPKPVVAEVPKPVVKAEAPATAPPAALGAPVKAPVPVKAAPAPVSGGGAYVQIGAYKSQADADAAWRTYKAKHATLLSGFDEDVQQVDLGEKGTWYRLRIKGFGSKDAAGAMCDRLKADGSSCILAR